MSLHADGRKSLGSDKVHIESIHPDVRFPVVTKDGYFLPVQQNILMPVHNIPINMMGSLEAGYFLYSAISKFGKNLSIDLNDTEDVWSTGGTRAWLDATMSLEIFSLSGLDDVGSTGATKVTIQGLDSNFDNQEAEVEMDGAGVVAISGTWMRVNRAFVSEVGTYASNNVGLIAIRIASAGAVQATILADAGQTEQTHFSLARNKEGLILSHYVSTDGSKVIDATLWQNSNIDDVTDPYGGAKRKIFGATGLLGHMQHRYDVMPNIVGPCDLWWTATSRANGTEVEAGFDLLIKDD